MASEKIEASLALQDKAMRARLGATALSAFKDVGAVLAGSRTKGAVVATFSYIIVPFDAL